MDISIEKLKKLPSKKQHENYALQLINNLLETTDAVSAFVYLKFYSEIFELALKNDEFRNKVLSSIHGKSETRFGATVEIRNNRRVYDYNNDSVLNKLEKQVKELQERIKHRKEMLESLETAVVDPETGEIINPAKLISAGIIPIVKFK